MALVSASASARPATTLYLSVLTLGELRKSVEALPTGERRLRRSAAVARRGSVRLPQAGHGVRRAGCRGSTMTFKRKLLIWIGGLTGTVATIVVVLVLMNVTGPEKHVRTQLAPYAGLQDPQFRREFAVVLGAPLVPGNRIANLENGDQIFPSMLNAIRGAQYSITFETFIYWSGAIGRQFAEAFAERARAGVPVHVLLDWVGSQNMEPALLDLMIEAGVEVERFHPLHWYNLGRMNNRTHRKLLVVDGRVGFTGGVGIADHWLGNAEDPSHWRDSHYRIDGPAVAHLQSAFLDNWTKTSGRLLQGPRYFPPLEPGGDATMQVFTSSPESGGGDSMQLMYLMLIAAAEHSIDLSSAYFVPDEQAIDALRAAMARGVRVRIIVPGPLIDHQIVRQASRAGWGGLLEAGAEIHEYAPTTFHCKMLVVDRRVVSIGSTNFDNRSFRLNDEASVNVFDTAFAARASEVFERDLERSERITLEAWQQRPWRQRLRERLSRLLASQL
jgi:cardiolipin synthase A/B